MTKNPKSIAGALLLLLLAPLAQPQSLLGTVVGSVLDEQGGALPGVTVVLSGKTGSRSAVTDDAGTYRFPAVDPGSYSVEASLAGFTPQRQDGIVVTIGKTASVEFRLKVGGQSESVDVVAEAPIVDVSTTATDNALSQDLLFNLPLNRFVAGLLDYTPGVNSGAAFGGGSDVSNGLYFDGVDSRSPSDGTAWVFVNFNIVEEVQVQGLGANAEYGSFTGAVVNTITRSGGNAVSGLFDVQYTKDALASDNVSAELLALNPELGEAAKTTKYLDFTAQVGGPIVPDKLFYFLSAQRLENRTDPSGPIEKDSELSPRFNGRLTWQPNTSDTLFVQMQYDQYNLTGRAGWSGNITKDVVVNEEAPELVWSGQWRHLFGSKTFLEAKFAGWDGYFDLFPPPDKIGISAHYDVSTNLTSDGAGYRTLYDRNRNQLNAAVTHFAEAYGKHELKFGIEIERSSAQNRNFYENGIFYYDYSAYYPKGQYYGYDSPYDFKTDVKRESAFVQDSWQVNSRLTINAGLRFDRGRGFDGSEQKAGKAYDFTALAPRVGLALDLTGDQKTVLKAHYGDFVDALSGTYFRRAVPGFGPYTGYCYSPDATDFVGPEGNTFDICNRVDFPLYNVDPDLKHPRVQQYTATLERALTSDMRLAVTGTYRKWKNFVDTVLPDARWIPFQVEDRYNGGPITVYELADQAATDNFLITNPDGFQYFDPDGNLLGTAKAKRDYKGLMIVLNKRLSHRWQAQASYVYSRTEGTVNNDGNATRTSNFLSPNRSLINSEGPLTYDRRHEFKLLGTVQVPKIELAISPYWVSVSGFPYQVEQTLSRSATNLPFALVSSTARTIYLEPRGSRRTEMQHRLDVRFEKIFKLGGGKNRLAVYGDVFNLLNADYETDYYNNVADQYFLAPPSIVAPRQWTLGARWSF